MGYCSRISMEAHPIGYFFKPPGTNKKSNVKATSSVSTNSAIKRRDIKNEKESSSRENFERITKNGDDIMISITISVIISLILRFIEIETSNPIIKELNHPKKFFINN